jgi:hypothetical protein
MVAQSTRWRVLANVAAAAALPILAAGMPRALDAHTATIEDSELSAFWPEMNIHERSALVFPDLFPELAKETRHRYGAYLNFYRSRGLRVTWLHPRASPTKDYQLVLVPFEPKSL